MLPSTSKHQIDTMTSSKKRKESLRDFIKTLGSVGSLPGHLGKPFSTSRGIFHQVRFLFFA